MANIEIINAKNAKQIAQNNDDKVKQEAKK